MKPSRRDNMSFEQLNQEVIEESKSLVIYKIGFTSADPFVKLKERMRDQEILNYASSFEKGTNEERTEPKVLLKEAKSIISIALAYPSRIEDPPKSTKEDRRGIFSRASWGEDYHHVLRRKLEELMVFIKAQVPDVRYEVMRSEERRVGKE